MNATFSPAEECYLISWAKEDRQGSAHGPARAFQRVHGVHSAVLGQFFARLSTFSGRSQHDLVEGPAPETPATWPWPTQEVFEDRLKLLLPASTLHFLEELGALTVRVS